MRYTVSAPGTPIHAAIQLPASKSISNRALILHALAHGKQTPCNLSDCDDTRVMVRALQGNPEHIDIMAAGTAMRFLTAYLSVTPGSRIITGTQRMQQRPIRILVDSLRLLGAKIDYAGQEGFPPLRITGTELQGDEISLAAIYLRLADDGSGASQRTAPAPYGLYHLPPLHQPHASAYTRLRRTCRMEFRKQHHRISRRLPGCPVHRGERLERGILLVSDIGAEGK